MIFIFLNQFDNQKEFYIKQYIFFTFCCYFVLFLYVKCVVLIMFCGNAFISGPYWKLIVVLLNMPSTINKDVIIIIIFIIIFIIIIIIIININIIIIITTTLQKH